MDSARFYLQQQNEAVKESNGNGNDTGGDATQAMPDDIEADAPTVASGDDSLAEGTTPTLPTSVPIPSGQKKKSALARVKAALARLSCRKKQEPREVAYEFCASDGSIVDQAIEVHLPAAQPPATMDDVSMLASHNVDGRTYDDDSGIVAQSNE